MARTKKTHAAARPKPAPSPLRAHDWDTRDDRIAALEAALTDICKCNTAYKARARALAALTDAPPGS